MRVVSSVKPSFMTADGVVVESPASRARLSTQLRIREASIEMSDGSTVCTLTGGISRVTVATIGTENGGEVGDHKGGGKGGGTTGLGGSASGGRIGG